LVASMTKPRWGHSACVLGGRIFVVGGQNDAGQYVEQAECYDPKTNQWSTCKINRDLHNNQRRKEQLIGHALVVV